MEAGHLKVLEEEGLKLDGLTPPLEEVEALWPPTLKSCNNSKDKLKYRLKQQLINIFFALNQYLS